ncbi:hypothetical protein [Mobilicoccus massiliensis]|uniref:hypothetical protein n=1 Tax=Mobilicoccus massiliensis TaxID=1522310 RepID=UPI0006944FB9|nr:hypothetical protein [Mobilicoccus massiliensis]
MQKKHVFAYPLTALFAFGIGAAGASGTAMTTASAPAPTATVTVTPDSQPAQTVTVTKAAAEPPPAQASEPSAQPESFPGDGTYEVGVDIQPGKYASDTPVSGNCYWARLKSDDPFDGILANNNSSGKSVVVIKKSDKYFQSSGCADWTKR